MILSPYVFLNTGHCVRKYMMPFPMSPQSGQLRSSPSAQYQSQPHILVRTTMISTRVVAAVVKYGWHVQEHHSLLVYCLVSQMNTAECDPQRCFLHGFVLPVVFDSVLVIIFPGHLGAWICHRWIYVNRIFLAYNNQVWKPAVGLIICRCRTLIYQQITLIQISCTSRHSYADSISLRQRDINWYGMLYIA